MNKNETDKITIEALLAEMPVEPSKDFCDRVLSEIKKEERLDALLAENPVEPSHDFVERTMEKISTNSTRPSRVVRIFRFAGNVVKFPPQARRVTGLVAACAVLAIAISPLFVCELPRTHHTHSIAIANSVADTVRNDPELYALWTDDEASSFDDLLAVSEIISAADLSTLELLASNDSDF